MERNRRGLPCIALRFRSESRFVSVGNHVQFRFVSVGTQQTCAKFGGHMHMVDFAIQPQIEQPVDKRVDTRNIFQRARRIRDVLRLHMIARSNRDSHLFGDFASMLTETERGVDMHHVHSLKRGSEQRVARLGELHLLLLRHPTDQRHMVDSRRVFRRTNAYESDRMALPFQFLRPLQCRIRSAIASVSRRVDHHGDGQGALRFFLFRLRHALHPTPMAQ